MLPLERVRAVSFLCLTIFGCTGNILTLIIVNQRFFRKTTSASFISALSISDCIVLYLQSFQILAKSHPQVTSYDCIVFFLIDVFRFVSVWIICLINIERCTLVFNPLHIPRVNTNRKARILILITFILSLLTFSHYVRHMHISKVRSGNQTVAIRSFCAYKPTFNRLIWECIRSGLTYWTTVTVCIFCNVIIILRLHQALKIERSMKNAHLSLPSSKSMGNKLDLSSKQRQLTAMLLMSSIFFVLTATPSTIHFVYLLMIPKLTEFDYVIHIFTNILLHFHYASNFLVFLCSCTRFRLELVKFFRRFIRCQINPKWRKRSTPFTENIYFYSARQNRSNPKILIDMKNTAKLIDPLAFRQGIRANADLVRRIDEKANRCPPREPLL